MRATKRLCDTATLREWKRGVFFVVEIKSDYGLPTIYLVGRRLMNGNQAPISRHRTLAAAMKRFEEVSN